MDDLNRVHIALDQTTFKGPCVLIGSLICSGHPFPSSRNSLITRLQTSRPYSAAIGLNALDWPWNSSDWGTSHSWLKKSLILFGRTLMRPAASLPIASPKTGGIHRWLKDQWIEVPCNGRWSCRLRNCSFVGLVLMAQLISEKGFKSIRGTSSNFW